MNPYQLIQPPADIAPTRDMSVTESQYVPHYVVYSTLPANTKYGEGHRHLLRITVEQEPLQVTGVLTVVDNRFIIGPGEGCFEIMHLSMDPAKCSYKDSRHPANYSVYLRLAAKEAYLRHCGFNPIP